MNGLLSLFLAGATLAGPAEDQAPKPKIDVSAQIYMPDGKASGASRRIEIGTEPVVLYVYTGKTLCEARTVSTEKPMVAGNGWKVTLDRLLLSLPVNDRTGKPEGSAGTKGPLRLKASWQRLWENGRPLAADPLRSTELLFTPGSVLPLDTIDGAARQVTRETSSRLRSWKPGDPTPIEFEKDGRVVMLLDAIAGKQQDKMTLKSVSSYGNGHPRIVAMDAEILGLKKQVDERIQSLINATTATNSASGLVDGCAALSMNLQVQAAEPSTGDLFETEIWLVHRDPAGKETTQRQVVRTRGTAETTFYFDDTKVGTDAGNINAEIFGTLKIASCCGGQLFPAIGLTRRYSTTSPQIAWKSRGGSETFSLQTVDGEALSLQLPPLSTDDGALVGHRFSLRVRVKVLQ